jgi:SAM-dependent methyltransferase
VLRSRLFHIVDFCATVYKFYLRNRKFAKTDLAIISEYWLDSPFAISKRYLQLKLEPDVYQYGETPLLTIEKIAQEAHITEHDCVFELGCGTGRCAFWLTYFTSCRVVGIEQIPDFTDFSNQLVHKDEFLQKKIRFLREDFFLTDLTQATIIYCYGSKMNDEQIESLILNMGKTQLGTIIITVSYSLNEIILASKNYAISKERFLIIKRFEADFFWGKTSVFVQKKLT